MVGTYTVSRLVLQGAPELMAGLKELPIAMQNRIYRPLLSKASRPIVKSARENIQDKMGEAGGRRARKQRYSGLLKRAMGFKVKPYGRGNVVVSIIGPLSKITGSFRGRKRWPAKYAHLVEKGHEIKTGGHWSLKRVVSNTKRAWSHGKARVEGWRFLARAYESNRQGTQNVIMNELRTSIEREAARQAAKTAGYRKAA